MQCSDCSKEIYSENDLKWGACFRCRCKGVTFGFVSAEYGRSGWNNSTVKETEAMYKGNPNVEKVPARKELI